MELKGKNAIVTGASRGIGKAVALKLAQEGVNVVIAARNQKTLDEAPGKFFKFITGANESKQTFNQFDLMAQLERMIMNYDPDEKPLGDFLYGIKAYPNIRAQTRLKKRDIKHASKVAERQRGRLKKLAAESRALTKAEKATMRRGRRK